MRCLAQRSAAIARKHWDLDVFKAGEISALAIEATLVAAQLGAANATDCVELALATNRRFLLRKLQNLLVEIRDEWQKNHQMDAVTRLNEIVDKIHSA